MIPAPVPNVSYLQNSSQRWRGEEQVEAVFTRRQTTSCSNLMLNLQERDDELESVRDTVPLRSKVCFNSTTLKITTFVNGVW